MSDVHVVVLAAGKGTRMKSAHAKVLHRIAGRPMIEYVLSAAAALRPKTTTVVVGHQAAELEAALAGHHGLTFVVQEPQLGTAHALLMTEPALEGLSGTVVLLSGDVPLLSAETLAALLTRHQEAGAAVTVATAEVADPAGYGRIVRSGGELAAIVEDKDASSTEREIREINGGIYAFSAAGLFDALREIAADNAQGEYYLPDLVSVYRKKGRVVTAFKVPDPSQVLGINTRAELAATTARVREAKNAELMAAGVSLVDPATAYVEPAVRIGADTIIHPGVTIERGSIIGRGCEIHSGVRIVACELGDRVTVLDHCLLRDSQIGDDASVGPFAHIRNQTTIEAGARVGNFVEVKHTSLGVDSKAMHHTYLGDAVIGKDVNIGAGTITCNYDGTHKHTTTIEDGAFIGSDSQLIAPVTIGAGAYVGTGTTVRENVPEGALAVSAGKQRNITGWVAGRKERSPK